MDNSKKSTYLYSIDALRVIAIIAVIAIHASIKTLAVLDHNLVFGFTSFFINQVTRFAVPLFFLISGFVLELNYGRNLSYLSFFRKRASRVIIPFIFWSLIYIFYSRGFRIFDHLNLDLIYFILQGKASYHLYFIPTLIIFYLVYPIFHKILYILKKPAVLLPILSFQIYLLYIDYYVKQININPNLRIAFLSFSIFIMGMAASHSKEKLLDFVKKYIFLFVILFVSFLIFIPFHVYSISIKYETTRYIYNQYNPLNYFYTIVFAALFFYILEKKQFARKIFIKLSSLSFFVFFIHVLVQYFIWNTFIIALINYYGKNLLTTFYFTPVLCLILSFISFSIAFIIHKIPYLSKITG